MRALIVSITALVAACATQSGVVDTGGGTFFVSRQAATGFSGMGNLRADALREAASVCAQHGGGAVTVTDERQSPPPYLLGNYPRIDLTFRCA